LSYARLLRPLKRSSNKVVGGGGARIGNAYLKWAFSEAAWLWVRGSEQAKRFLARKEKKHGKAKALGILAARLGRTVSQLLRRGEAFAPHRFWKGEPGGKATAGSGAGQAQGSARRRARV